MARQPSAVFVLGLVKNQCFWKGLVKKMIDLQQFEGLLEALQNEIEWPDDPVTQGNMQTIYDGLYGLYEDLMVMNLDRLEEENTVMRQILADRLSDEDKRYYRIKYGIDLGV